MSGGRYYEAPTVTTAKYWVINGSKNRTDVA